ncbi:MAG: hypothetical protein PVI99_00220 [Anaerolineales bacterium]|jgi:hypothetical protein
MRIKSVKILGLFIFLSFLLSSCFLRLLFGTVAERDTEFGRVFVAEIGGTWGPMAICDFDESGTLVDCSYTFIDLEGEFEITSTSSAELISEFGILGVFVDPLILQVPDGATNFTGTFDDGNGPYSIVVTETNSFTVQPGTMVTAEAGQKFVILEFPPSIESALIANGQLDGPFDFNFEFELPSLSPVEVKPMYTGRVEVGGETFYVPLLPCVTDFAAVPAITIPVDPGFQVDLMPQILDSIFQGAVEGCNGQVYDFTGLGPGPVGEAEIDIKPGSDPNAINCSNLDEVIAVAILTTNDFDATAVDHTTVTFEGASETHVDKKTGAPRRHEGDVDEDGDLDLVFHFRLGETNLTCESSEGILVGETFDASAIEGMDGVNMVVTP